MLTPADVEAKRFTVVRLREGYHQAEVDDYLDNVIVSMKSLEAERNLYRDRAEATIQLPPVRDDAAKASRILDLADAEAGRIKSGAQAEAATIVQRAKVDAEEQRRVAQKRADEIIAEGTESKHAEVGRLEDQRQKLEAEVQRLEEARDLAKAKLERAIYELGE